MKYLKIGEEYEQGGEKKFARRTIGFLFTAKNGKDYVKLYHIPNQLIHVVEKDDPQQEKPETPQNDTFGGDDVIEF